MTAEEYFGDWMQVIDKQYLFTIMRWLKTFDRDQIRPDYPNIFKAFKACPFSKCNVVMVGMDPYHQPGVATGILFGNSSSTPESELSPSLKVIKESLPEIEEGEVFDNTMEYWEYLLDYLYYSKSLKVQSWWSRDSEIYTITKRFGIAEDGSEDVKKPLRLAIMTHLFSLNKRG